MSNGVAHQALFPMTPAELVEHLKSKSPRIHLPIIQRDSVWRAQQICELWDSLMCGIPIPSLVLQKVSSPNEGTATKTGEIVSEGDYWLLDGQQRATAICIGFEETTEHRLWLDLAWKWEDRKYSRRFGFYLCSMARPWGDSPDLNGRPGAGGVREARKSAGISDGQFDFEIPLVQTWPVAATAPIPFTSLLAWARNQVPNQVPDKEQLRDKVAQIIDELGTKIPKLPINKLADEYWNRLATGLQRVAHKPLVTAVEADMDPDDLLEAFTRLNRNGTRPTDSELFFSALKKEMPQCNTLIKKTCTDNRKAFGELNVLRAFTVLATEKTEKTKSINGTTLNLALFKTINEHGREAFQQSIEEYLRPSGTDHAIQLLNWAIDTLRYRSGPDAGLPVVLLPRLGVRTWLPVLHWFECQGTSEESREKNRDSILRYILTDHFFADWTTGEDKPLRELLRLVEKKPDFPTLAEIESEWSDKLRSELPREGKSVWLRRINFPQSSNSVLAPLSPDQLAAYRHLYIVQHQNLPDLDWFAWPANRSHDLLLWSQRAAMDQWFAKFLPQIALIGEIGRPWDIDHIVPNDFFMYQSTYPSREDLSMALKAIDTVLESGSWDTFRRPRNFLGNRRVWPAGWNRSDQNAPISVKFPKFPQKPEKMENYLVKSDWWNKHAVEKQDALAEASAISFADEPWEKTPEGKITNGQSNWNRCAMQAFLQAVFARENRLYKELFEFLKPGFDTNRFTNKV